MNTTSVQYICDGSTKTFSIPFSYLDKSHVEVFVNGIAETSFELIDDYTIQLEHAPAVGLIVAVDRKTPIVPLVDFSDGSTLTADQLDLVARQALYVAAESVSVAGDTIGLETNGQYDALNRRLVNLAAPVSANDAVNKQWVLDQVSDGYNAHDEADRAFAARDSAEAARDLSRYYSNIATDASVASTSAKNTAQSYLSAALNARNDSETFANNAATSANAALNAQIAAETAASSVVSGVSENTANTIVKRDSSGNFAAGTITAALAGNASTATKLATARTFTLSGAVSGSASFDGSSAPTITTTLNSIAAPTFTGSMLLGGSATGSIEMGQQGSANTPYIDFHSGATNADYDTRILASGGNGTIGQGTLNYYAATHAFTGAMTVSGGITGNASTATKLATARTLSLTGDATGSASFDGSANAYIALTLAASGATAGSYGSTTAVPVITVDAKGRITAVSASSIAFPVTSVAGRTGAVTLTSSDITTALGYSPVNPVSSSMLKLTNASAQSTSDAALWCSGATGAIMLDDAGHKRISWSDGSSNLSFQSGTYFNGTNLVYAKGVGAADGGVACLAMNSDASDGFIRLAVAPIGVAGSTVAYTKYLDISTSGVYVNGTLVSLNGHTHLSADITDAASANTASVIVKRDASGNFSAGTITAALTGNASTATKLATARTLSLTGDATGSASFDGSAAAAIATTLAASGVTAGTYGSATLVPVITVDAKGRITSATTATITAGGISSADPTITGTLTLGGSSSNGAIEIGRQGTSNTPYIDFHSSATATDYDARILASGGTATAGQGTLNYYAATHVFSGASRADEIIVGYGTGSVGLTVNDGGGNASLCFNHNNMLPDQAGSSARIKADVDATTAKISFMAADSVSMGVSPTMTTLAYITTTETWVKNLLTVAGAATINQTLSVGFGSTLSGAVSCGSTLGVTGDTTVAGVFTTTDSDGTFSSGTYTPTPNGGNIKNITNNGAFTFAAPTATGVYTIVVEITNGSTAGAVTFSGFAKVTGDSLTTTNTNKFQIFICKTNGGVTATAVAMQ